MEKKKIYNESFVLWIFQIEKNNKKKKMMTIPVWDPNQSHYCI